MKHRGIQRVRNVFIVIINILFAPDIPSTGGRARLWGAGIAQWLERRTRDRKVAGSNPCRSGGRIFFSRVNFLC